MGRLVLVFRNQRRPLVKSYLSSEQTLEYQLGDAPDENGTATGIASQSITIPLRISGLSCHVKKTCVKQSPPTRDYRNNREVLDVEELRLLPLLL